MNPGRPRSSFLVLLFVGVLLAACELPLTPAPLAHAEAPGSLAEVLALYASFDTYQDEATLSETTERGDGLPSPEEDERSHAVFWFRRPDRLRLEWTFDTGWDQGNKHLLVSDGRRTLSYDEKRRSCEEEPSLKLGLAMPNNFAYNVPSLLVPGWFPSPWMFEGGSLVVASKSEEHPDSVTITGTRRRGFDNNVVLIVDRATWLVHEIRGVSRTTVEEVERQLDEMQKEVVPIPIPGLPDAGALFQAWREKDLARGLKIRKSAETRSHVQVNQPIPDAVFAFAPPEGVTCKKRATPSLR
jgi:outer membrane lipoprotein-sorting protein